MRRSRLKILPARCLTCLGFILVMLVCPTIAEINIGDVSGQSDSEHPATKFLWNGFEVCQMKDSPPREDSSFHDIASLEEIVRNTRNSDAKPLERISRRGERVQNCYDSRIEDYDAKRNAGKFYYNRKLANREASEVRRRNSGNVVPSRTERGNSIELRTRNDMIKIQRRENPVLKGERLNYDELSYKRIDSRRVLRRKNVDNTLRNVDSRRISDTTRGESNERMSRLKIEAKNSNIDERRDESVRQSASEKENSVNRFTRKSFTRNQARISSERKPEKERSIVDEERRLKNRGKNSEELRHFNTRTRLRESERRDFARLSVRMTTTADPTERRYAFKTERQRETREARLNPNVQDYNHRESTSSRATRMARSLEKTDSEMKGKFSDIISYRQRQERSDIARRMVRSVDSIPAEMRSVVENERNHKTRETHMRGARQNQNRRLDRSSERKEFTRLSVRSLEAIPVGKRSMVDETNLSILPVQISKAALKTDGRRQESKSESLPSAVRVVRSSDSSKISRVDYGRRQRTRNISLNFQRHERESDRKYATRFDLGIVKSEETEPEERIQFVNSEPQQRIRGTPLNSIRQTDSREKQRGSGRRDIPLRIVRTESIITPPHSERQRRNRQTTSNIRRQATEEEMIFSRSSNMVRSRYQESRDATHNNIRQIKIKFQRRGSERRDLSHKTLKLLSSLETRSVVDAETQEKFRSSSRREKRDSQKRVATRQSIGVANSLVVVLTERKPTEYTERKQRTRDASMSIPRQKIELEGRENKPFRIARSTESTPQERRSFINIENLDKTREITSNSIRYTDNPRQLRESERKVTAHRLALRRLESIPTGRRLAVDLEMSRDITLSNGRKRESGNRDADRNSIRTVRYLESLATERRSNLESEWQRINRNPVMARSLERRSLTDLERKGRLPLTLLTYFTPKSRRQGRESDSRFSARRSVGMIRSLESNRIERSSISKPEKQQIIQYISMDTQKQMLDLERRKPELRSMRRVRSTELSERSVVDIERQVRNQALLLNSQRRYVDSERRDLADRVFRVARSLQSNPSGRKLPAGYERQHITREFAPPTGSEENDITRRVNGMVRSAESNDRRSEALSDQWTRDAARSFRRPESQTARRYLNRHSRTSEQRNDRQRREVVQRFSLEKDIRTASATSQADRREDSSIAGLRNYGKCSPYVNHMDGSSSSRKVKDSRASYFVSDTEESNYRLIVSRASPKSKNSLKETSILLSKEARNLERRGNDNLRTFQNLRFSQSHGNGLDSRSRNRRVLSVDKIPRTIIARYGMRNPPTRRINPNSPISIKMEIRDKEGRFETIMVETCEDKEKFQLLGSFYISETQLSPDMHVNARNVISNDHLLGSSRRNAMRSSHLTRDTISRTASLKNNIYAAREFEITGRILRDAVGESVFTPSKVRNFALVEHRKNLAVSKNSLTRRISALHRRMPMLQNDIRVYKAIMRSQSLNGRVNDRIVSKSSRDLNGSEKEIPQLSLIANSYDGDESYNEILYNDQGIKLEMQLSVNGSSPFTDVREMNHLGKIVHDSRPFEDEEYEHKIGYGLNHDKLFSLTIGGSVAAFLISTSLK